MAVAADSEAAATALKVKGNKAFAQHDWPSAIDLYTKAIEKNGKDPSFYCNRAQVRQNATTGHERKTLLTCVGEHQA